MQVRNIILILLSATVTIGLLFVVFNSQGSLATEVEEAELDKALAAYKSAKAKAERQAEAPIRIAPTPQIVKSTTSAPIPEPKVQRHPEVVPTPEFELVEPTDLKSRMNDANQLYDRADYEGARSAAVEILAEEPDNVRMQRIVVSSSCIMGDQEDATKYFNSLPPRDKRQMSRRCARYGVSFADEE